MPGVKRERADSVGVLTLDEPATLNAMTPDLLGDLAVAIGEMTADPQVRALVLTGAGRGFCSGQNLKAAANPRRRHRRRRDALLLAGVQGAARMPGADRGRRQRRRRRRRLQPRDGRRHDRRGALGEIHSGVQPDRAGARSRLDLAAAAPGRPPARARTDAEQRAAVGGAGEGMGTGPRGLRRCRADGRRAGAGAQARRAVRRVRWSRRAVCSTRANTRLMPISSGARSRRRRKSASAPMRWRDAMHSSRSARRGSAGGEGGNQRLSLMGAVQHCHPTATRYVAKAAYRRRSSWLIRQVKAGEPTAAERPAWAWRVSALPAADSDQAHV